MAVSGLCLFAALFLTCGRGSCQIRSQNRRGDIAEFGLVEVCIVPDKEHALYQKPRPQLSRT
ncbi:hypothetical protein M378DRAFT_168906, partial [Amanita muscaria Koide BX008]